MYVAHSPETGLTKLCNEKSELLILLKTIDDIIFYPVINKVLGTMEDIVDYEKKF
jgi:hypothetical protein